MSEITKSLDRMIDITKDILLDQANSKISELEKENKVLRECLEYYLPILEERLSCGAHARNTLANCKKELK